LSTPERSGSPSTASSKLGGAPSSPPPDAVVVDSGIEPQNPFDSVEIPSLPTLSQSSSGAENHLLSTPQKLPQPSLGALSSGPTMSNDLLQQHAGGMIHNNSNSSHNTNSSSTNHYPLSGDLSSMGISPSHPSSPTSHISQRNQNATPNAVSSASNSAGDHSISSTPTLSANSQLTPHQDHLLHQHTPTHPQSHSDPTPQTLPHFPAPVTQQQHYLHQRHRHVRDDDENTEPSSAANTADQGHPTTIHRVPYGQNQHPTQNGQTDNMTGSLVRLWQDTRRRLTSKDGRKDSDEDDALMDGALICGFLQKFGRNGKWQTRWFETDGECLSYYKNSRRNKLLATLDLEKVGYIGIDPEDTRECSFTIQVLGRLYHLRADSRAACKDWVITLNRVKEARLQQGNVKLVNTNFSRNADFLDPVEEGMAPRVVVVANRQRTRAVDETDQLDQLYQMHGNPNDPAYMDLRRRSAIGTAVIARWTKHHSSLQRLGSKLSKWARSVKKYGCQEVDSDHVYLDRHVHPPGHDDKKRLPASGKSGIDKESISWSAEETTNPNLVPNNPDNVGNMEPYQGPKPEVKSRCLSTASEDFPRMLS
jgi:hypothetical protein